MPELPEVEYVARQLRAELIGQRIVRTIVYWHGSVTGMDPGAFGQALDGRRIEGIERRAKYLLIALSGGQVLVVHRGMSGKLLLGKSPQDALYVRVAFELEDGRYLLYSDPRKFGRLQLRAAENLPQLFARLGPEPLDVSFSPDVLAARLSGTHRPIKAALLDQAVVAGLGNIYADEALFQAKIHPLRAAGELGPAEIRALVGAIQAVLNSGIEHGGTTIGRHRDVYNESGTNLEHIMVYRRTEQPCLRCGSPIQRITVGGRSTHFCPTCQRLP
jgi:formamidopyrimidine-DNA glycosylase